MLSPGQPERFVQRLQARPLVGDAAKGTTLAARLELPGTPPPPADCYSLSHPEAVLALHREHLLAGSEVLVTNSFAAVHLFSDARFRDRVGELCQSSLRLARLAGPQALVGGSITGAGPEVSDVEAGARYRAVAR